MPRAPLTGPSLWTGAEMVGRSDWIWHWSEAELTELLACGRAMLASGRIVESFRLGDVPLPVTAPRLALIQRDLEEGSGIVNLRGLPIEATTPELLRAILWAIGLHLGMALSQSKLGELLGEVRDTGCSAPIASGRFAI